MKKTLSILLLLVPALAFAKYPKPRDVSYELNNSPYGQHTHLGTMLMDKSVHVLRAQWDYAVQGGAVGTINLTDIDGKQAVLPPGAIIKDCVILVDAALGSGGSPTIGFSTGDMLQDLKGDTAFSSFGTDDGLVQCGLTGATFSSWKKLPGNYTAEYTPGYTSEYTPTMTIKGATLTRGKLRMFLEYILSR